MNGEDGVVTDAKGRYELGGLAKGEDHRLFLRPARGDVPYIPIQTTVALADANGRFTSQEVLTTPADPKTALSELIAAIKRIKSTCRGKMIEGGYEITFAGFVARGGLNKEETGAACGVANASATPQAAIREFA